MSAATMTSLWGVHLEGLEQDLKNFANKLNGSITSPSSFFVSMFNEVYVVRSQAWDRADDPSDAYQLALADINLIRGCLDALDGCHSVKLGTVYKFKESGRFDMSRDTNVTVIFRKKDSDLATPEEFGRLLAKVQSNAALRTAFEDLTADAPWIDIYRSWESLKSFHGGEHKVHRRFNGESSRIKRMTRTANKFRHVKTFDSVPDPMPRNEAIGYLKGLLLRSADYLDAPKASGKFAPGQEVRISNYHPQPGQPYTLDELSIGPAPDGAGG